MQIVSAEDILLEISKPIFWVKRKYFKLSSAELFTQRATRKGHGYTRMGGEFHRIGVCLSSEKWS